MYSQIKKRSGQIVSFNEKKISIAIAKAGKATGEFDSKEASKLTKKVLICAEKIIKDAIPRIEQIQDIVEDIVLHSAVSGAPTHPWLAYFSSLCSTKHKWWIHEAHALWLPGIPGPLGF